MRDLHARAGAAADLDRLVDGFEQRALLVARVRRVEPVAPGHHARHRDDLVGGRVATGRVLEPGGEAEGPLVHALLDRAQQARQLLRADRPVHDADRDLAQRALADEQRLVDGDARLLDVRAVAGDVAPVHLDALLPHRDAPSSVRVPSGAAEEPQLPVISVVTPWRTRLSAAG